MDFKHYFDPNKNNNCYSCLDTLCEENYVLYKDKEENDWYPCIYCSECIKYMLDTQWGQYMQNISQPDCAATLRRILESGPPINLRDKSIICNNDNSEVYKFYFSKCEQSAKLKGSLVGEEREKFILHQKEILKTMENIKL